MWNHRRADLGFTLIELLVAIAVIAVLLTILVGSFRHARNLARDSVCRAHLNQIAKAFHHYADANNGSCPDEDSTISWDEQMLHFVPDRSIYRCPSDRDIFARNTGLSYGWRNKDFAYRKEYGSISRRRLDSISPNTLIMLFDWDANWHKEDHYNIAQISTAVRQYHVDEYYQDMWQPVK